MKIAILGLAAALSAALSAAAPAFAQGMEPPQPLPPGASPGMPQGQAVDPAPGATRPFLGHPGTFYDPAQRLKDIDARAVALPPAQRRRVAADVRTIDSFAATQRARHGGELRDWDRERMTRMMNDVVAKHPELRGDNAAVAAVGQ